jgi:ABC transporter DrrB family efflux protein
MTTSTVPPLTANHHRTAGPSSLTAPRPTRTISAPERNASYGGAVLAVAGRTLRQFWRTPQILVVGGLTSVMFLLIFRFVFGGAVETGSVAYVDLLIPALAAGAGLFGGGAAGMAEDIESGVVDRLRSLPIPRSTTLVGRSLADTILVAWNALVSILVGFAVGFRFHGSVGQALLAFGLCIVFGLAFTWPLIWMGLVSGSAQAAQGMSFLVFPLIFVSSAYVPISSMPSGLQAFANHQPFTFMVGAVRSLTIGDGAEAILGHPFSYYLVWSLVWCVAIIAVFAGLSMRRFRQV